MRSTWLLGSLIGVLSWHPANLTPAPGYDGSWIIGLNWGTARGLDYGSELVFTYGPLGFGELALASFGTAPGLYSALFLVLTNLGLGIVLLWAARRLLPLPLALAAALLVAVAVTEALPAIAFVICAMALLEDEPGDARMALAIAGPVIAAIGLLTKLNDGVAIALMVTVALLTLEWGRPRPLLRSAAIFAVVFAVAWFAAGQGVGNLDDYMRRSFEISSGYAENQVVAGAHAGRDQLLGAVLIVAATAATALLSRRLPQPRRGALVALVLVLCFAAAKHGFIRHDATHMASFLWAMFLPWLVLPWSKREWPAPAVAVAVIALVSIPVLGSRIIEPRYDLSGRASQVDDVVSLVDPDRRDAIEKRARREIRRAYPLPARQRELLERGTVHGEPQITALIWGYGLDWRPPPNFDASVASVPAMDEQNAAALAGPEAPDMVLRYRSPGEDANSALDGHYLPWDTPAAFLETLCRYSAVSTGKRAQVLRGGADRCGEPRTLRTVTTSYREPVKVPPQPGRGNGVILAKITGLGQTPLEWIKTAAFRGDTRSITLGGGPYGGRAYPFFPDNAGAGLIVSMPAALDFPAPFALAPNATTLTIDEQSPVNDGSGELEVRFELVPLPAG